MFDKVMPYSLGVFVPPNRDRSYAECFDFTLVEIYAFGLRSFETKLKRIGIDPNELELLAYEDRESTYEERARRLWVLIDAGVVGDDTREPEPTGEAVEILFESLARSVDLDVARGLEGPIEWAFTDGEPWHIVVTNGHAEAKPGSAGSPALRLESSLADWAKIAVGRFDPRWALLKRRLKVSGSLGAKAKLSKCSTRLNRWTST
jgi:hypothetical protein